MKKERFDDLIEKYKQGRLSRLEYQELLSQLKEPGMERELDKALNHYWKETNSLSSDSSSRLPLPLRPDTAPQSYRWWSIAASLILIVGFLLYFNGALDILKNQEVVYRTGFSERQEITLNDGSQITLNANSTIQWSNDWKNSRSREVILKGEAFFEIKKQAGIPFTVHTDDVAVEVLGTSFNVDTRVDRTEVYLKEGEVNLKLFEEKNQQTIGSEKEIIMKPGDQIRYDIKEKKVDKLEGQTMLTAASWKNNVLNFKNMKFSEVLDLLREIYGQSFECSDKKLLTTPMYLGVPYSDWEAVRQALELSLDVEFQAVDKRRYKVLSTKTGKPKAKTK